MIEDPSQAALNDGDEFLQGLHGPSRSSCYLGESRVGPSPVYPVQSEVAILSSVLEKMILCENPKDVQLNFELVVFYI